MSGEEERNGNLIATEAFPDRGLIVVRNPKSSDRSGDEEERSLSPPLTPLPP